MPSQPGKTTPPEPTTTQQAAYPGGRHDCGNADVGITARAATSSPTPPAPTCSPARLPPARQQTTPASTPAIPSRRRPRPPRRHRHDQADQPQQHPATTGPATSAPPAATMPAPRKTTRRRPPGHPPADYQQPDNPASQ